MEWIQTPIAQLGALGGFLSVLWLVGWLVFRGHLVPKTLVPRSTLDDVRADRDERVAEANADADEWRRLWEIERDAHELTRRARDEEIRAALAAATEGAQVAARLLRELKSRQIETGP